MNQLNAASLKKIKMGDNTSTEKLFTQSNDTGSGQKCGDFGLPECEPEVLYAIPMFIITVSIVTGNSLILTIFARIRNKTGLPVVYLANLTVSDLGVGIANACFSLPLVIQGRWPYSRLHSDIVGFFVNTFSTVSAITLGVVSVDRYLYISRPLTYNRIMTKSVRITILAVLWLFSAGLGVPCFFGVTNFFYNEHAYLSYVDFSKSLVLTLGYTLGILLPVILTMVYFYTRIYLIVKRHIREMREQGVTHKSSKHVMTTLVFTVLCFVLCWSPYAVNEITFTITKAERSIRILDFSVTWLAASNSFLNCLIYWFRQREVRAEARAMFGLKTAGNAQNDIAMTIHHCPTAKEHGLNGAAKVNEGYQR